MPVIRIAAPVALIAGVCFMASATGAQEPKLERGMKVVAKSPDFVLRDGANVIPSGTPFDIYRVEQIEGDRVRLHADGREGDARASDVVSVEHAEAYFSEQIKSHPRTARGYLMRSAFRRSAHDGVNARLDCNEAIRIESKNPWAYLMRGLIAAEKGDLKNAIVDFEKTTRLDARIAQARAGLAHCHFIGQEYGKAFAELDEAIRRNPHDLTAHVLRGRIWEQKGDREKALREFDEAVRLDPKSAVARAARAEYYGSRQEFERAMADANEAIRLDPTDGLGIAYVTRARIASQMGDLDKAIADLNEAIRLDPKDVEPFFDRALCFLDRNDLEKALSDVSQALRLDPNNADALHVRGEIFMLKGDSASALVDLDKSIQANPRSADALVTRATALISQGKLKDALRDLDKALEIEPEHTNALNARAAALKLERAQKQSPAFRGPESRFDLKDGKAKFSVMIPLEADRATSGDSKEVGKTLDGLNELIKTEPRNAPAYNKRGLFFLQNREYQKALADFDEAIRLDPKDAFSRYNRGVIHYQRAEYAKALADFDEVVRLAPESPAISGAYEKRASIRSTCEDAQFLNARLAVESASKACQLTAWKDVECLMTLALAQSALGDPDAAIAAIDKSIALLKPDDKRIETCQFMRETFRGNLVSKLGVQKFFER